MCHCNPNIPTVRCRNCPDTEVKSTSIGTFTVDIIPEENQIKIIEIIHTLLDRECYVYSFCGREDLLQRMDNITEAMEEVSQIFDGW